MDDNIEDFTEKVASTEYRLVLVRGGISDEVVVDRYDPNSIMRCFLREVIESFGGILLSDECLQEATNLFFCNESSYEGGIFNDEGPISYGWHFSGVYKNTDTGHHYVACCDSDEKKFIDAGYVLVTEFWLVENGHRVRKVHVAPSPSSQYEVLKALKEARHH